MPTLLPIVIEDPWWPRADQWLASGSPHPRLQVVGVPTSAASLTPSRADLAPRAMRAVLGRFSSFQGEDGIDLASLEVADFGDWDLAGLEAPESLEQIAHRAAELPPAPVRVFLGGDNSITWPLVRSTASLDEVGVLTLDAHHDVRTLDLGPVNGNPIRALIEDGLPGDHVVQVGIHGFANSVEYRRYCDDQGVVIFTMDTVDEWGVEETLAAALDHLDQRCGSIYLDIDMDVLDLSLAPGCPGARPGGMNIRQLARAARDAGRHPKVVAADLVEVDPARDVNELTVMNMAIVFLSFVSGVARR